MKVYESKMRKPTSKLNVWKKTNENKTCLPLEEKIIEAKTKHWYTIVPRSFDGFVK